MAQLEGDLAPMRVLVVEDNPKMASAIQRGLRERGFSVDVVGTGFDGEERMAEGKHDLMVLDLMLPDRDGIEICRNLRRRRISAPILILTALGGTGDKVGGLDAGADDYLVKPFEFDELVARVRALLRRGEPSEGRILRYADLELDLDARAATRGETRVNLSNREFALLECLMRQPDRVVPRMAIGERVWNTTFEASSNVIEVYVSALRRKIDRDRQHRLIHTVKGVGYRLGGQE